jgi:hypothetical protein
MAEKVMLIADTNAKSAYPIGLLKLALSLSGKHYDFAFLPDSPTAKRQEEMVHQGSLSEFWTSTSKELETEYRSIRIPIYKGLLGVSNFPDQKRRSAVLSVGYVINERQIQEQFEADVRSTIELAQASLSEPVYAYDFQQVTHC